MKTIALVSLLLLSSLAAESGKVDPFATARTIEYIDAPSIDAVTFRVSRVGRFNAKEDRETLLKIFEQIQSKVKAATKPGTDLKLEIRQHVGGQTYLALPIIGYSYGYPKYGERIAVDLSKQYADGDSISVQDYEVAGLYEYTNTLGSISRVRHWKPCNDQPSELTQEAFLQRLKYGESFSAQLVDEAICQRCKGDGDIKGDPQKGQHPDKDYRCPECRGKKTIKTTTHYKVVWE